MDASAILCLLWVSLGSCLVYKFLTATGKTTSSSNARRPPGPAGMPLLGNIFDLRGAELHHALARLAGVHGPVMSLKLGTSNAIVVSSAAGARDVLQKHDQILAGRSVNDAARGLGHHEVSMLWLPATSPVFKRLRAVCNNHLFSARGLDETRAMREGKVRELVGCLRDRHAGQVVSVGVVMLSGMLNLMSNVLFSEDVADLNSDDAQELETLLNDAIEEITKPNLSDLFPVLSKLDLQSHRRNFALYIKKLYDFFDRVISRRRQSAAGGEKKVDFLDVLLQLHSEDQFSLQTIKSFLLDLFVAGTSTTSLTVEWTLAELLRHPAVMSKVRGELQQVLGSKEEQHPDESDIDKLPYLRAVVMEIMRLHPPAPLMMPHLAMAGGAEVGGFPVPKGTQVIVNVWAIMRDPASWEQPEAFMPERFLGTGLDFRGVDARAFVPFGAGRRQCPGMPVATRSVMLILASVLHAFEWSLPDGMRPCDVDVRDRFGTSLNMVTPLKAVPTPVPV
ncbi:cytochrome P450 76M5-like [Panicum miliaceum]|uniref:Cytochrome P450 76M5-like n=1 Tax=Panicum miliaceum TaxID=4540 RepID=A0A3L6QCX9_PANMI|nr:cytochrome P450 76M5-like [Panicum miliaceum]